MRPTQPRCPQCPSICLPLWDSYGLKLWRGWVLRSRLVLGVPVAIVAITLAVSHHDYVTTGHCWLSVHTDTIWALWGPCTLCCELEAWGPGGERHVGEGEALSPTDARSPGQWHPGPCGDGHHVQCLLPCPHAEPTALPATADENPDMERLQSGGIRKKWGSQVRGSLGVSMC